jgi:hypothetical protein
MTRQVALRAAGIVCSAVVMSCLLAGSSQAATLSCGDVVTSDTVLSRNVTGCTGNGLIVAASGVRLDLNGHTVSGTGAGTGILVTSFESGLPIDDVDIVGGTVRGFATGVAFEAERGADITGVGIRGLAVTRNGAGIELFTAVHDVELRANRVTANTGHGIVTGDDSAPVDVVGNAILRNGGDGLRVREDSAQRIEANLVAQNGGNGMAVTDSVATITRNLLLHNGAIGLSIFERVPQFLPRYVVADNVATLNATGGMIAQSDPPSDVGPAGDGNIAKHNGGFDCILITCN